VAQITGRHAQLFGLPEGIIADFGAAHKRSRDVADGRTKGVHYLMKKNGIQQFAGSGVFRSATELEVQSTDGAIVATVEFGSAIIATGSTVRSLPGVEFGSRVTGYVEKVLAESLPERLVVIGAGPIGIEYACVAASFGSQVTVVEYQDRILPLEDPDVSAELAKSLKKLGIRFVTSAKVTAATETAELAAVSYLNANDEPQSIEADQVLVAVGFSPSVAGFGLEHTGVELAANGAIAVDGQMRTSVPNIYAIGDVTAKLALAHVAEAQGILAAEAIATDTSRTITDYSSMPRAVYSTPQVASVGLTEAAAAEAVGELLVAKFPFVANGKAHAIADAQGFVKLVASASTRTIVGAHLVGPDVSELLPELSLAMQSGTTIDELATVVHAHPTLSESLQEAFHGLAGHMINF
ncbi:MAG: dihydrolipoyl dehydrogenase family protein, partial [Agromyces sp.]